MVWADLGRGSKELCACPVGSTGMGAGGQLTASGTPAGKEWYFEKEKWVKGDFCSGFVLSLNVHLGPLTLRNYAGVSLYEGAFSV